MFHKHRKSFKNSSRPDPPGPAGTGDGGQGTEDRGQKVGLEDRGPRTEDSDRPEGVDGCPLACLLPTSDYRLRTTAYWLSAPEDTEATEETVTSAARPSFASRFTNHERRLINRLPWPLKLKIRADPRPTQFGIERGRLSPELPRLWQEFCPRLRFAAVTSACAGPL